MNMQKVLIISNDNQRLAQAKKMLNEGAFNYCCHAVGGKDALAALHREPWHLLIADMEMPEVTGLQLINAASTVGNHTNILLRSMHCPTLDLSINTHASHKGVNLKISHHHPLPLSEIDSLMERVYASPVHSKTANRLDSLFVQNIVAYFQPIHCAKTGALKGGEALMRWLTPHDGIRGAEHLLPLLQSSASRTQLWEKMFEHSLIMLRALKSRAQDICIGINVTSDVANSVEWAEGVAQRLAEYQIKPEHLVIEITEQEGDRFDIDLCGCISQLRLRGIKCAIDDFGTGFSSLQRLSRIPFSLLKLDRQFITDARSSPRTETILQSTIQLARDLGLQVVAEGVESAEDHNRLQRLGCDFVQGYHYSKPVSAEEFLAYATLFRVPQTDAS